MTLAAALGLTAAASASSGPLAGLRLAQATEKATDKAPRQSEHEPSEGDSAAQRSRQQPFGDAAGRPPSGDGDSFSGSAEPAGPDLTAEEERELISRGWN